MERISRPSHRSEGLSFADHRISLLFHLDDPVGFSWSGPLVLGLFAAMWSKWDESLELQVQDYGS